MRHDEQRDELAYMLAKAYWAGRLRHTIISSFESGTMECAIEAAAKNDITCWRPDAIRYLNKLIPPTPTPNASTPPDGQTDSGTRQTTP